MPLLRGKAVFNLFFENSTRTRTTFEIAAKRLSADVINLNIGASSTTKGETLLDTVDNLVAMDADMFVVRHAQSGAPHLIAAHLNAHGRSARPRRQRRRRPARASDAGPARPLHDPPLQEGLPQPDGGDRRRRAAFARGALADPRADDARHARSARDRPADAAAGAASRRWACACSTTCAQGLRGCDVVVMLRLQSERMKGALLPSAGRILQALRPDAGQARAGEARRRS